LMLHVLEMGEKENIPVGFYGADPNTLQSLLRNLQNRFPGLNVVYSFSPPFVKLDQTKSGQVITEIINSGARILFVGLGCPKQELWIAEHKGKIPAVMLGVGAAFDFHAGLKSQAPVWMQNAGLEWLYRLWLEPRRLWRRYLYNNPRFILLAMSDLGNYFLHK
jgi:N-acetylglucosaminyldiphosphoundecaprenol N-acetyl-beta-D-mannosaminyltransferase